MKTAVFLLTKCFYANDKVFFFPFPEVNEKHSIEYYGNTLFGQFKADALKPITDRREAARFARSSKLTQPAAKRITCARADFLRNKLTVFLNLKKKSRAV